MSFICKILRFRRFYHTMFIIFLVGESHGLRRYVIELEVQCRRFVQLPHERKDVDTNHEIWERNEVYQKMKKKEDWGCRELCAERRMKYRQRRPASGPPCTMQPDETQSVIWLKRVNGEVFSQHLSYTHSNSFIKDVAAQ